MAKVSYKPEEGSDENTEQFGFSFKAGKTTDVPDDSPHLQTFRENPFFEVDEAPKKAGSN